MSLGLHVCEELYKEATYCEKSQVLQFLLGNDDDDDDDDDDDELFLWYG